MTRKWALKRLKLRPCATNERPVSDGSQIHAEYGLFYSKEFSRRHIAITNTATLQ